MGINERLRAVERVLASDDASATAAEETADSGWVRTLEIWLPQMMAVAPGATDEERQKWQAVVDECHALAERIRRGEVKGQKAILEATPRLAIEWMAQIAMRWDMYQIMLSEAEGREPYFRREFSPREWGDFERAHAAGWSGGDWWRLHRAQGYGLL